MQTAEVTKIYMSAAILAVFFLAGCLPAVSQEGFLGVEDQGNLMDKLSRQSQEINTIHSKFVQEKHLEFLDEIIVSSGHFWFQRENSLRWAYQEPFDYLIIIHEGKFLIRDGEDVSSFDLEANAVFKEINDLIIGMVRGNIMDEKRFEIRMKESCSQYLLFLEPKEKGMKEVLSGMELFFEKEDLMVSRIVMRENAQDYTVISFTDRKINEHISEAVFSTDY